MTGRERIVAALSSQGTEEFPAVVCYPSIFTRDHFSELTTLPWWSQHDPDPAVQARLLVEQYEGMGIDWFGFGPGMSRANRAAIRLVVDGPHASLEHVHTGERTALASPVVSGTLSVLREHEPAIDDLESFLASAFPPAPPFTGLEPGAEELPQLVMSTLGQTHFAYYSVGGPLWSMSGALGYEQWFGFLATDESVMAEAARRVTDLAIRRVQAAAAAGCHGVWIEDCLTDQIGYRRFADLNLPLLQVLTQAIRDAGMYSIYYFCGDPWPVFDLLLDTGADALSLEESKKGFAIDIDDVVARVRGRMAVLGNLDAIDLLEHGTLDDVRREVARQLNAGRRNNGRFIMSTGSPVTPGTSPARLRAYVSLVRELSGP